MESLEQCSQTLMHARPVAPRVAIFDIDIQWLSLDRDFCRDNDVLLCFNDSEAIIRA